MPPDVLILLELLLVFGAVLLFAWHQRRDIDRERARRRQRDV